MPDDHAAGINSLGLLRDLNRRRAAATLEDDDDIRERLEDEEERLASSQAQLAAADRRIEDVKFELKMLADSTLVQKGGEISFQDVLDLKEAFKDDINDVFVAVVGWLEEEEQAKRQLLREAHGEEEGEEGVEDDMTGVTEGAPSPGSEVPRASVAFKPISFEPPVEVCEFRLHDVYTFGELRVDMCRYVRCLDRLDEFELYNPMAKKAWPDGEIVLNQLNQFGSITPESCVLHPLREEVKVANEFDAQQKADAELQIEMLARADVARRRSNALRAIAFERKRNRHHRSLILRGRGCRTFERGRYGGRRHA